MKLIIQRLWSLDIGWDKSINLHTSWNQFINDLSLILSIKNPRKIMIHYLTKKREIRGFCDASETAYGVYVYLRETYNE